ncbi:hypothetical protein HOY82DRAFT_642043 [Tuber indicum]|nr:hypothetical protein HOY82DRAFT_642043 [Tuber indicum]
MAARGGVVCSAGKSLCERFKDTEGQHRDVDDLQVQVGGVWEVIGSRLDPVRTSLEAVPDYFGVRLEELHQQLYFLHSPHRNFEKD